MPFNFYGEKLIDYAICICIGLIMSLPTGSVINIPAKIILLMIGMLLILIKDKIMFFDVFKLCFFVFMILLPWLLIGFNNWGWLSIREFQMISVPLLVGFIGYKVSNERVDAFKFIIIIFLVVSFLVKFITCLFFYFGIAGFNDVLSGYITIFGSQFVGLVINSHLIRVFLSSDVAIAMAPLFILAIHEQFSKKMLVLIFVISTFTVFIGYSRSVWAVYFLSCVIFFIINVKRKGWTSLVVPMATVILLQLATSSPFYEGVYDFFRNDFLYVENVNATIASQGYREEKVSDAVVVDGIHIDKSSNEQDGKLGFNNQENEVVNNSIFYQRFLKFNNESSDDLRNQQLLALWKLFLQHPILGVGLGGYDPNLIRSATEPYSYEVQLFSLLPKLGVFGFLIFSVFLAWCFIVLIKNRRYAGALVLVIFLLAGMLNPYLFSSSAALVYLFLTREIVTACKRESRHV